MKKLRVVMRIITGFLVVLTVVGIIILLVNQDIDPLSTTYEIIAFSVGMAGMIMAVVTEIDSYSQEKTFQKMIDELHELNREADHDEKVDAEFQKKLDELIVQNRKIYSSVRKSKKKKS